jgi:hypothetical protein
MIFKFRSQALEAKDFTNGLWVLRIAQRVICLTKEEPPDKCTSAWSRQTSENLKAQAERSLSGLLLRNKGRRSFGIANVSIDRSMKCISMSQNL